MRSIGLSSRTELSTIAGASTRRMDTRGAFGLPWGRTLVTAKLLPLQGGSEVWRSPHVYCFDDVGGPLLVGQQPHVRRHPANGEDQSFRLRSYSPKCNPARLPL
ncbi:hypothetical protein PIB30_079407 [Stylosanthes scabra]|uniref:Uncharacterized protein n=1 Tax=Stylosanthes scabra TaxID=79078 RepID=A0ABU6TRW6_9FABA|nr:hypothetical protein [Stylosanthes scabra]